MRSFCILLILLCYFIPDDSFIYIPDVPLSDRRGPRVESGRSEQAVLPQLDEDEVVRHPGNRTDDLRTHPVVSQL